MGPRLADSHVHLHAYDDVDGLLERARAAGVALVVGVGIDLATSRATVEIARRRPDVIAAVGLHPTYLRAEPPPEVQAELEALAREPVVGFVGEIGLDQLDSPAPRATQISVWRAQLALAQRVGKPVNLHVRGAFAEAFAVLAEERARLPGAVLHYFVGDAALASRALDLGLLLSVGKPVTRTENQALREAVRTIPLAALLLETDSYPLPGRTTEPADVSLVARAVAQLKGCSEDEVAEVTTTTLLRLLGRGSASARTGS